MAHGLRMTFLVLLGAGLLGWALPRRILRTLARALKTISGRPRIVVLVIWIVALMPMIHMTRLVRHYSVNVPTFDDWAMAPLIVKAHTGQLALTDLFQQQQEARTVLPNLIFVLSARSEWNVRDQMAISLIACWLTAAGIFVLLRRLGLNLAAVGVCFWLMVLTLFSPAPFELWLLASGFPSFLPLLFLVTAMVAIGSELPAIWKFLVCLILAVASSFTLANGLLAWAFTFPMLLLLPPNLPRRSFWLAAWGIAAALCALLYFWGYEKPAYLPQLAPAVSIWEYISFILQFLGGGLAYSLNHNAELAATIFGLVQVALLVIAFGYIARRFHDRRLVWNAVPWFVLALYSLGSAVLAAIGRVGYGASYALASRYVPFSCALTLSVIALVPLVLSNLSRRRDSRPVWRWGVTGAAVLVLVYLGAYKVATGNTLYYLQGYSANDRLAKAAIFFSRVIDTSAVIKQKVFPPNPEHVVRNTAALDDLNLLRPPLARSNKLSAFPHEGANGARIAGRCETLQMKGESCQASGWALLKAKSRPADCVAVSYELPGEEPVLFAISGSREMRWDIARTTWPNDYLWAGWSVTFPAASVPPGATLGFWAVDADEPRLYRLDESADRSAPKR